MKRHGVTFLIVTAAFVVLSDVTGCLTHKVTFDEEQFDRAIARIDRMTQELDKGLTDIKGESAAWRKALAELENQLREDFKDVLANEVRMTSDGFIIAAGTEGKAWVDYLEAKLKDNLIAFRAAMDRARAKVIDAKEKKDKNGIKMAFDELANVIVYTRPVVTSFNLAHVELRWNDHSQTTGYIVRNPNAIIEVGGWGFERPSGQEPPFSVWAATRDKDGKITNMREFKGAYEITTRYKIQIVLDRPSVKFEPNDNVLFFSLGSTSSDQRSLPIRHVIPDPRTAPEVIARVVISVRSTNIVNFKPAGNVQQSILANQEELSKAEYPIFRTTPKKGETIQLGLPLIWDQDDMEFALKRSVEVDKNNSGRLSLTCPVLEGHVEGFVEMRAKTNRDRTIRYDKEWRFRFEKGATQRTWDFSW